MSVYTVQRWRVDYRTLKEAVFIDQGEFLSHALDAYRAALRGMVPPDGECWIDPDGLGTSWSNAEDLVTGVLGRLGERLRRRAILTGHMTEVTESDDEEPADLVALAPAAA